jgi:SAM-dependent methyltransferase
MDEPRTWHYGVIAEYWAAFNDDFRPFEIPYFRRHVERGEGPALDVGCGTGRVLLPLLRADLDVDGCDVSPDMVSLCRTKAEHEGLAPALWAQPMHELEPPRAYRTIYVCGAFGLGSTREQDTQALRRFHDSLEPGGTLLVDIEVPYADSRQWQYWSKDGRASLPRPAREPGDRKCASDGSEYALSTRLVELDPLEQRVALEIRAQRWREGRLEADETRPLTIGLYFRGELALMLEQAGFVDIEVQGDHNDAPATADDDFLVFLARRATAV